MMVKRIGVLVLALTFASALSASNMRDQLYREVGLAALASDDCDCEDDAAGELLVIGAILAAVGVGYALIGDNPGSAYSYGRYPWSGMDALENSDNVPAWERAFNADPVTRHGFLRPRIDVVRAGDEDLSGMSLFFKAESSYLPAVAGWYQQVFDLDGNDERVGMIALEPRIATGDEARIFWSTGFSTYGYDTHDAGAWFLGIGAELWMVHPFMFEIRAASHIKSDVIADIYVGVNYQVYKSLFLTAGYRGLYDIDERPEDEARHYFSLGLSFAFGV